ncbi:DNA primase [Acholeplasma equirhinis]|uniref:DNA primase n=1 Tax=Acholeplasma equirhinis TaxID=555393 RepID=UPI00197ACF93|nr:DNA primase [Acholeplasma equirhinis]MBN3490068.1 DNA primase [Acholeplasma equirhinis]
MDQALLTQIIEQTDIVALASEFMSLTKRGKNYMGLCPFHDEKTPSFSVSPEKHLAKCMGCGKGGNTIQFYSQIKNIPFEEAVIELGDRLGLNVKKVKVQKDPNDKLYALMEDASSFYRFALKNSEAGSKALEYLKKRDLSEDDIEHFEIGYAPNQSDALYQLLKSKNYTVTDMMNLGLVKQAPDGSYYDVFRARITFPVKSEKGRIIGFSARTLNPKEVAKYVNSPESKIFRKGEVVYHFQESLTPAIKQKHVILHEGFFDVIASYKAGLKSVVATMGTALTQQQANLIKRISNHVVIAYDGDDAGQKATLKAIPHLRSAGLQISVLALPNKLDPDEYVKKHGLEKYANLYERLQDPYQFGYEIFKKNKNFERADDITLFKKEMDSILRGANQTVLAFYQKKVKEELGIDLFLTKNNNQKIGDLLPKKQEISKVIVSKAERSIDLLLIDLLKTRNILKLVQKHLDLTRISTVGTNEQVTLYKALIKYYVMTGENELDIDIFKKGYAEGLQLLDTLINKPEFKKRVDFIIDDKVFKENLKAIESFEYELEVNHYKHLINQNLNGENVETYAKKLDELTRKKRGMKS